MPRKPLIRSDKHFYHVVTRSNHKDWFALPMEKVWKLFLNSLALAQEKYPAKIGPFILMSNHYHLLILTPNSNLDQFMYELNKNFSLKLRTESLMVNRMFGGRYKGCLIKNQNYLWNTWKYIFQNPIRANITDKVEDYPFGSLKIETQSIPCPESCGLDVFIDGEIKSRKIKIASNHLIFSSIFPITNESLDYLNRPIPQTKISELRKALKKTTWE